MKFFNVHMRLADILLCPSFWLILFQFTGIYSSSCFWHAHPYTSAFLFKLIWLCNWFVSKQRSRGKLLWIFAYRYVNCAFLCMDYFQNNKFRNFLRNTQILSKFRPNSFLFQQKGHRYQKNFIKFSARGRSLHYSKSHR